MTATHRQVMRGMAVRTHRSRSARSLHAPSRMSTLARVVPRNAAPDCSNLAEVAVATRPAPKALKGGHSERLRRRTAATAGAFGK